MVRPSSSIRRRMSSRPTTTRATSDTAAMLTGPASNAGRSGPDSAQEGVDEGTAGVQHGTERSGPPGPLVHRRRRRREPGDQQRDLADEPFARRDPDGADLLIAGRGEGDLVLQQQGS